MVDGRVNDSTYSLQPPPKPNSNLLPPRSLLFLGGDISSENLIKISSRHAPHSSIIADTLSLPHPRFSFDFVISIAVIHHLSTSARRVEALAAILEMLRSGSSNNNDKDHLNGDTDSSSSSSSHSASCHRHDGHRIGGGGQALIYVWALEQKHSRRGWDEGDAQDVMVPWVMTKKINVENVKNKHNQKIQHNHEEDPDPEPQNQSKIFNRYYHLYRQGELEEDIRRAGGVVEKSGYERDNWWAIASRRS